MKFSGGENAALSRVHEYFWKRDLLSTYKKTRNGMVGADYSTKLSPWLATGCLSPRLLCEEVARNVTFFSIVCIVILKDNSDESYLSFGHVGEKI